MKSILLGTIFSMAICSSSVAQLTLDDFNVGTTSGSVVGSTNWATFGNTTQNPETITVGGTATNVSGWAANFAITDFSAWNFLAVTAQIDAGNQTPALKIGFIDDNGDSQAFSILADDFSVGSLSTVYVSLAGMWTTVNPELIVQWNIGGGAAPPGTLDFRMTFGHLGFTMTDIPPSPVPEPSTYAAIAGAMALGFVAWRRRSVRA